MYFLTGNPFLALRTPIRQWKWSKIAILCPFPVMGPFSITPLTQSLALQKASSMSILAHFVEISCRNFENWLIYDQRKSTGWLVSNDAPMHYVISIPFKTVKIQAFPGLLECRKQAHRNLHSILSLKRPSGPSRRRFDFVETSLRFWENFSKNIRKMLLK